MLRIAVIGLRGHAARHIALLKNRKDVSLSAIYYHRKASSVYSPELPVTNDFNDILQSNPDAIIISSPTPTHGHFLSLLKDYKGYVLVEKPAFSSLEEARSARLWTKDRKSRVKINFNLDFSDFINHLRETLKTKKLGKPVFFEVESCHGLAFKKGFQSSWRATSGVTETVAIHHVYTALKLFGKVRESRIEQWKIKCPNDTGTIELRMKRGLRVFIKCSYSSSYSLWASLLGTQGSWEYRDGIIRVRYPRNSYDLEGRFMAPDIRGVKIMDFSLSVKNSMKAAQDDFIDTVKRKGRFSARDFNIGLMAGGLCLKS